MRTDSVGDTLTVGLVCEENDDATVDSFQLRKLIKSGGKSVGLLR